jgi:hypothetical protein
VASGFEIDIRSGGMFQISEGSAKTDGKLSADIAGVNPQRITRLRYYPEPEF